MPPGAGVGATRAIGVRPHAASAATRTVRSGANARAIAARAPGTRHSDGTGSARRVAQQDSPSCARVTARARVRSTWDYILGLYPWIISSGHARDSLASAAGIPNPERRRQDDTTPHVLVKLARGVEQCRHGLNAQLTDGDVH